MKDAILSFSKGTSCSVFGLRAQHLADGLKSPVNAALQRDLTKVVRVLAEGRAPVFMAPFVAGASLAALDKTKHGVFDVRPIAAGQIIRRIVAKCMCATQKDLAASFFRGENANSGQFGVACPAGAERIIHRTRLEVTRVLVAGASSPSRAGAEATSSQARETKECGDPRGAHAHEHKEQFSYSRYPDFVILKVDLKNAFNNVSRKAILDLVVRHFPEIARWVYWCYGRPGGQDPILWFKEWVLESKEGVQQGDPLGPLLFSMVIQELITAITKQCKLALNLWYLDDGVLAGSATEVHKAFLLIQQMGPDLGLELNVGKTELVTFFDGTPDPFPKTRLDDDGAVVEQGVKRLRRNFDLLGSPIGDPEYCATFVSAFTDKAVRHTLDPLSSLDEPPGGAHAAAALRLVLPRGTLAQERADHLLPGRHRQVRPSGAKGLLAWRGHRLPGGRVGSDLPAVWLRPRAQGCHVPFLGRVSGVDSQRGGRGRVGRLASRGLG